MQTKHSLSPAQRRAFDSLDAAVSTPGLVELRCMSGLGRSTVLRALHERHGGVLLDSRTVMEAMEHANPLALEETIYRRLVAALSEHPLVILDDAHLLARVVIGCHAYPRSNYFAVTRNALAEHCQAAGKRLVLGSDPFYLTEADDKERVVQMEPFDESDYAHLGQALLGPERAAAIDFSKVYGPQHFYQRVAQVFEAAKQNAPGIIFIDDSDVIFESGGESGLYRYLLTMLDGLESESAGRVCVIMTAMDVGNLPPALARSGRIELWLETRYPDLAARREIFGDRVAGLAAPLGDVELGQLAESTDGLSGADLKRVVEDAKILFGYDRARGFTPRPALEYFVDAANTVRTNRERYAEAEARARANRPVRPPIFDVGGFDFAHHVVVSGMMTDGG